MTAYLTNFILCSGLLLLVYRLLLANESMYRFNRFYLLLSLAFSLTVPCITRTVHAEAVQVAEQSVMIQTNNTVPIQYPAIAMRPVAPERNYWPQLLFALYGIVTAVLLTRFIVNLYRISRSVKQNTVVTYYNDQIILTGKQLTPHSFFKYIFVNKDEYHGGLIVPEIICHEQAHVKQLHSLDVLIIELLQVVCWFNPFIPLYRKAIQLNHEFLADEAVVKNQYDTSSYQYLLLAKASQFNSLNLTSQFNYPTIKKRLIMMTKTTSAKMALIKQMALIPLLAGAMFLFSQKVMAQSAPATIKTKDQKLAQKSPDNRAVAPNHINNTYPPPIILKDPTVMPSAKDDAPNEIVEAYKTILRKYNLRFDSKKRVHITHRISGSDQKQLIALYKQMSKKQQHEQAVIFFTNRKPFPNIDPTEQQLTKWKNDKEYQLWIDTKRIANEELSKYKPSDFNWYQEGKLSRSENKYAVQIMTKSFHAEDNKKAIALMNDYQLYYNAGASL